MLGKIGAWRARVSPRRVGLTPPGDNPLYVAATADAVTGVPPDATAGITEAAPGFTEAGARGLMRIRGAPNAMPDGPSASGQTPAFEREALACLDSLYRTARRLSRDRADAEDLVQDTYLKAFRAADQFEPGTNLRAWLFTILHNTARNRFRDRARDTVAINSEIVDRAADAPPPGSSAVRGVDTPETLLLRDTLAPELQSAIDALPRGLSRSRLVTRRGRVFLRRNRQDAGRADRHRDVPHLARPAPACSSG